MKCRMKGQEAESYAEDEAMRAELLGSIFMGDGDCLAEGGEWYVGEDMGIDACAAECKKSGQVWFTMAEIYG